METEVLPETYSSDGGSLGVCAAGEAERVEEAHCFVEAGAEVGEVADFVVGAMTSVGRGRSRVRRGGG
jgi:hypothetical protein